jgi:hypothetical protein
LLPVPIQWSYQGWFIFSRNQLMNLNCIFSLWQFFSMQIFGSDPSCADYLTNLIQILFSHTVQLLRTIQVIIPAFHF